MAYRVSVDVLREFDHEIGSPLRSEAEMRERKRKQQKSKLPRVPMLSRIPSPARREVSLTMQRSSPAISTPHSTDLIRCYSNLREKIDDRNNVYGAAALPLVELLADRGIARRLFPHMHGRHKNLLMPLQNLNAMEVAGKDARFVDAYFEHYATEKAQWKSIEDFAITKLNELQACSTQETVPNRLRTAICTDLLNDLLAINGSPVLERLKFELFRSIYAESANVTEEQIYSQGRGQRPVYSVDGREFFENVPFFEQLKAVQERWSAELDSIAYSRSMSMRGSFARSNISDDASMRVMFFKNWKDFVDGRRKAEAETRAKTLARMRREHAGSLRKAFRVWNQHRYEEKIARLETQNELLQQKVQETMQGGILLMRKKGMVESQMARLRQLRDGHQDEQRKALNKQALKTQAQVMLQRLEEIRAHITKLDYQKLVASRLLMSDSELKQHKRLADFTCEEVVLRWVNYQLSQVESAMAQLPDIQRVTNFSSDFENCSVLLLLLHQARGDKHLDIKKISRCFKRSKRREVIENTLKEMHDFVFDGFVTIRDLLMRRTDIIFSFLVSVMSQHPMMPFKVDRKALMPLDIELLKLKSALPTNPDRLQELLDKAENVLSRSERYVEAVKDHHKAWLNTMHRLEEKATQCFAARRIGAQVWIRDDQSNRVQLQMTKLPWFKLRSVLKLDAGAPLGMVGVVELQACEGVLVEHFQNLLNVFNHYATLDDDVQTLGHTEVLTLVKECKIQGKQVGDSFLRKTYKVCNMSSEEFSQAHDGEVMQEALKEDRKREKFSLRGRATALTRSEFAEWLVRVAAKRFHKMAAPLASKLEALILKHILRYSANPDELRNQLLSHDIAHVFHRLEKVLHEAFIFYSNLRKAKKSSNDPNHPRITFEAVVTMLEELQLMSSSLTRSALKGIFKRALFSDDIGDDLLTTKSSDELDFESFCEMMAVIAIYKKPDPYLPLATRIEDFLMHSILLPLFHKRRITRNAADVTVHKPAAHDGRRPSIKPAALSLE